MTVEGAKLRPRPAVLRASFRKTRGRTESIPLPSTSREHRIRKWDIHPDPQSCKQNSRHNTQPVLPHGLA